MGRKRVRVVVKLKTVINWQTTLLDAVDNIQKGNTSLAIQNIQKALNGMADSIPSKS